MNVAFPALTAAVLALMPPPVGPIEGRERYPFAMSMSSGPVGTVIEMKSTSPCPPPPPGETPHVLVDFLPPTDHGTLLTTMEWFPVAEDGSWTASVTAEDSGGPASGPARVAARCAAGPDLQRDFTMTTRARGYWLLSEQPAYRSCGACPEPFPDHVADFGDAFWYGSPDGGPRLIGIAANERTGTGYWPHDAGSCGCRAWDPARPLHFIALAPTPNTYSQHDPSWPRPTASPEPGAGG